ncbi:MAG: glycosyltransferase family 2 protein [Sulfuricurvum sp.]|nr:glycosyltransferase family 2 protein [Sulfuricurvum sp.]
MNKKILVLLSTYNGEKYLQEQLDSLFAQSYKEFEIIARDDGSCDNSLAILKAHNITLLETKQNLGAKKSFEALLKFGLENRESDYFMFCDQDDVWESDKIEKSYLKIQEIEHNRLDMPVLVHSDLKVVDTKLATVHGSFWEYEHILPRYNSLNRLLMQNTITGCTMIINKKLAEKCLPIPEASIMHDWWIGLVASQFGAIGYIEEATISYRQHSKNTIGAKKFTPLSVFKKAWDLLFHKNLYLKHLHSNLAQAKAFLETYQSQLDQATKEMLQDFIKIEEKTFWQKRSILLKYKLLKQGFIRNIGLFVKI